MVMKMHIEKRKKSHITKDNCIHQKD